MEWINVEDELPPLFEDVLACCINFTGPTYDVGERYHAIDRLCKWMDKHPTSFRCDRFFGKVSHWQYLPKLPEEEIDENGMD
jgi:hypothetical protein